MADSTQMVDRNSIVLEEGDLVMIIFDTPVEYPARLAVYVGVETVKKTKENGSAIVADIEYLPLTEEGLEVAQTKYDTPKTGLHREKPFIVTNLSYENLTRIATANLDGASKIYYDSITALIT